LVTERPRCWKPLPHDLVQVDHGSHAETAQWTGHGPASHDLLSAAVGHSLPPSVTRVVMKRVRRCVPVLHVTEHSDHEDQLLMTQSTGQLCVLQSRSSARLGHW